MTYHKLWVIHTESTLFVYKLKVNLKFYRTFVILPELSTMQWEVGLKNIHTCGRSYLTQWLHCGSC